MLVCVHNLRLKECAMSNEATQRSPEQPVQPVQLEQDLAAQLSPRWAGRSL